MVRERLKQEVAQIAEAVAREKVFTHGRLMDAVFGQVHDEARKIIWKHSQDLLPELAIEAVRQATPDEAEVRARLIDGLRGAFGAAALELVNRTAEELLPALAADAARQAAPDPAVFRAELAETTALELTKVRKAVEEAAPGAVAHAIEARRDSMTEAATQAARDVLPELARQAVDELGDLIVSQAQTSAAMAVAAEAGTAVAAAVTPIVEKAAVQARNIIEQAQRRAITTIGNSVAEAVDKKLAEFTPNIVEVVLPARKRVKLQFDTHQILPELLVALHARCHVLLVGPAGTGKSMLARHAAHALEIPFQALSLGPTTPMSKMFGYFDAHGEYHDTPFRRAFEHGGVMLLDELDNGHAGLLAELNQALALGICAFPDGMVDAHEDFRLVATGNTYGTGGDRQYAGRQTLDSATLDRFVVIDVPIDEGLEERIALRHAPSHQEEVRELLGEVRDLREITKEKKLPVLFSPRASIDGAKLLEAGATVEQVLQWRIVRGLSAAHRRALDLD